VDRDRGHGRHDAPPGDRRERERPGDEHQRGRSGGPVAHRQGAGNGQATHAASTPMTPRAGTASHMNQREATQQNRWPLLAHPARDTSPAWSSRTELPASGNARRQQRNGSTVPVTGEIMPTPRQSASVDWVKIFDPTGNTENPTGQPDSIPVCLEP